MIIAKINPYSNIASKMAQRQISIHLTNAVDPSSGLAWLVVTVLSVLTVHKNRVTRRPRRPGIESGGIKKLT